MFAIEIKVNGNWIRGEKPRSCKKQADRWAVYVQRLGLSDVRVVECR